MRINIAQCLMGKRKAIRMLKLMMSAFIIMNLFSAAAYEENYEKDLIKKISKGDPKILEAYENCEKSKTLIAEKKYEDAIPLLKKALELDQDGKVTAQVYMGNLILRNLAFCYEATKDYKNALNTWEKILVVDPDKIERTIYGIRAAIKKLNGQKACIEYFEKKFAAGKIIFGEGLIKEYLEKVRKEIEGELSKIEAEDYSPVPGLVPSNTIQKAIKVAEKILSKKPSRLSVFIGTSDIRSLIIEKDLLIFSKNRKFQDALKKSFSAEKAGASKLFYCLLLYKIGDEESSSSYMIKCLEEKIVKGKKNFKKDIIQFLENDPDIKSSDIRPDDKEDSSSFWGKWLKAKGFQKLR